MPYRRKRVRFGGRGDYVDFSVDPLNFTRTQTHPLLLAGLQAARGTYVLGRSIGKWGLRTLRRRRRYTGHGRYTHNGAPGEGRFIQDSLYIQQQSSRPNAYGNPQSRAERLDRTNPFVKGALGEAYAHFSPDFEYQNVPKTIDGAVTIEGISYPCDVKATSANLDHPPTDEQTYKLLGQRQKDLLDYGPLAVLIHSIPNRHSYLMLLDGTGKFGPPDVPDSTWARLSEIGAITRDEAQEHTDILGTPYTPARRSFADILKNK